MFGTWKYDPATDEVQNLRQAFDPITARSSQHQACNRCHEKKLKCSGEKEGCERCLANDFECEYTRLSSRGSRRGKKTRRRSAESVSRDDSTSPIRSRRTTPQTKRSRSSVSSSTSPCPGEGSFSLSTVPPAASVSASHRSDRILDELDFSMLMPSDGFDLGSLSQTNTHATSSPTMMPTTSAMSSSYMTSIEPMTDATLAMTSDFNHTPPHMGHGHHTAFQQTWLPQQMDGFHYTSEPPSSQAMTAHAGQTFLATQDNKQYHMFLQHPHPSYPEPHPYWDHGA